jgi:hypothetical protein
MGGQDQAQFQSLVWKAPLDVVADDDLESIGLAGVSDEPDDTCRARGDPVAEAAFSRIAAGAAIGLADLELVVHW